MEKQHKDCRKIPLSLDSVEIEQENLEEIENELKQIKY